MGDPEKQASEIGRAPEDEVAAEQRYVDRVYARLDAMRRSAASVAEAYSEVGAGGTHQARLERDVAVEITQRRLAELNVGDNPLCFGRLDLDDRGRRYVGRVGVEDADHSALLVDWRAPAAEPFYRATPHDAMGVLRRRHLITRRGREVIGVDDEVFDAGGADSAGLEVMGEGALLRALERERTGRMGDIVATIQAEQDAVVRAELPGVLVVSGGPGTGKTAVALHRAAYLLYTYRRRLGNGVLIVGPSPVFLRYIEQVLPSLGEHDVVLSTVTSLRPGLKVRTDDDARTAALKGDLRMAEVLARSLADRERPPRSDVVCRLDGVPLRLRRADAARLLERARRARGTHNARRPHVERAVLDHLFARYRQAPGAPVEVDDPDVAREIRRAIRRLPELRVALDRMWPVLRGAELVRDLFGFEALIRSASEGVLSPEEQRRLWRERSGSLAGTVFTEADVALVDEADALCGAVEQARFGDGRTRRTVDRTAMEIARQVAAQDAVAGFLTPEEIAQRYGDDVGPRRAGAPPPPELRTYSYVLVDEAQDLTPMQWRMIARRCPIGAMTLVGDFAQASRPGVAAGWDAVIDLVARHDRPRRVELTVNYRTPAEIMDTAARLLPAAAPGERPVRSVRRTGQRPRFVAVGPLGLVDRTAAQARAAVAEGGTVAIVAPAQERAALAEVLRGDGAVADAPDALDAPIALLDARAVKGLEFDHVIVVEPSRLTGTDAAGLRTLYVALTRSTRTLAVVHADPLPEALEDPIRAAPVSPGGIVPPGGTVPPGVPVPGVPDPA